jgi:hypothetical protein
VSTVTPVLPMVIGVLLDSGAAAAAHGDCTADGHSGPVK